MPKPLPHRISEADLRALIRHEVGQMIADDTLGAAIRAVICSVLRDAGLEDVLAARADPAKVN